MRAPLLFLLGLAAHVAVAQRPMPLVAASAGGAGSKPVRGAPVALVALTVSAAPAPRPAFNPDSIFGSPEMRPQFRGGEAAMQAYLEKTLRYPPLALRQRLTGRVMVRFVLSAAGRVTDATVVRGAGNGFDEEALRLVWFMPAWEPARQQGRPVRVSCTMPIQFR